MIQHQGRPVLGAVALAAAGLLVVGVAVPTGATAAPHAATPAAVPLLGATAQAPLVKTSVTVGGKKDGTVPPPPADAMGTPAASTLVKADDLELTGIDRPAGGGQAVNDQWASPSYGNQVSLSDPGSDPLRQLLNPNYPTASGRFRDPDADRTMAFQMTRDGSNVVLQLSSNNSTTEPQWAALGTPGFSLAAGISYVIRGAFADHVLAEADADTGISFAHLAGPDVPTPNEFWTPVDVGDPDGYLQLVSKSDGLCLAALGDTAGAAVGTQPCVDSGAQLPAQLWKSVRTQPNVTADVEVVPKVATGLVLTDSDPDAAASLPVLGTPPGGLNVPVSFDLFESGEPGGAIPTWTTEVPGTDLAVPMALATGDLDRVVGSDENYHDEAVVAYADPTSHQLQVRVIDYNANASHLLTTAPDRALPVVGAVKSGTWFPGSVGVAVGDFGLAGEESLNEIAVTWQDDTGRFHLTMLKYRATATGGRALTVIGTPSGSTLFTDQTATESLASGYAETVAGDFAGDGTADVAIAYAAANPGTTLLSGHLGVVNLTSDLTKLRGETTTQFTDGQLTDGEQDDGTWTPHGLRLASGYFRDDAANGYTFQRRELAVVWTEQNSGHGDRGAAVYDVTPSPDCTPDTCTPQISAQIEPSYLASTLRSDRPIPVAVGGFEGVGTGSNAPLWDIAIWSTDSVRAVLRILRPDADGKAFLPSSDTTFTSITDSTQMVLTAYDRDGASLVLGAPLIFTTTSVVKPTLVAAQPPTQADWLDGRWVNVSRVGDFSVSMGSKTSQTYTNTYTTDASQTDGVTESADIKESLRFGTKDDNVTGSAELKQKFEQNWNETSSQFNKYSTTITTSVLQVAQDDDIVQTDLQTVTFYRYPILNHKGIDPDGTVAYPFYQVTVPGQVVQDDGYGRALSFYQPSWENGNALSYPKLVDNQVPIPDLGSYSYTDSTGKTAQVNKPLLDVTNDVGGGQTTDSLKITGETGSGTTTTNGWDLKTSVQVSASVSFKADLGELAASGSASLSVGYNGARSAGTENVGDSSASQAASMELNAPTIDSNASYQIGTAYYYDDTGTPKVIQGVDLTSDVNSRDFWERDYGRAPDPGLNLPDATFLTFDQFGKLISPEFSTTATRQLIRGFAALQPDDPSSPMTSGQPYATDPEVGDPVNFAVQVHDFSLMDSPSVPLSFYAVPVDDAGLDVTGAPQLIGTVQSGPIPSQADVTVDSPTWTAKGSGEPTTAQNWRIFVILDPDDSLNEIHPWQATADDSTCPADALDPKAPLGTIVDGRMVDPMTGKPETLACAQNNQGYGTITVMPKSRGAALGGGTPPKVTVAGAGFAGGIGSGSGGSGGGGGGGKPGDSRTEPMKVGAKSDPPTLQLDQNATGLIDTATTASTAAIQPVLVFDGPPSDGRLIASTTMNGATKAGGGIAQFSWRPATPGMHTLYLELLGGTPATDSIQTLRVHVTAAITAAPPTAAPPTLSAPTSTHTAPPVRPTSSAPTLASTGYAVMGSIVAGLALLAAGLLLTVAGRRRHRQRRQPAD